MKNRKLIFLLAALVLILALGGLAYRSLAPGYAPQALTPAETPAAGGSAAEADAPVAADFTVLDAEGNEVSLSDWRGKPVVVNFWATWCGPCQAELPAFDAACSARGEEIVFMMVNLTDGSQETVEGVQKFVEENSYSFPVYFDTAFEAATAYQIRSIPLTVFLDAQGRVIDTHLGSMSAEMLEAYLDKLE